MVTYSLLQAAKKLGLPASTLSTYLAARKIPEPRKVTSGRLTVHLWTERDIEHVRKLLPKIANGRKTRYQKKKGVATKAKKKQTKKK